MFDRLTVCLTHDVDRVYKTYQYLSHDLKQMNLRNLFNWKNTFWCFDEIMEIESKYNVKSTFFFLNETLPFELFNVKNWPLSLGRYNIKSKDIINIIQYLDKNGWEIGLHGSYNSYKDLALLSEEKKILESILGKKVKGIRQHHLNLLIPQTFLFHKKLGFMYDSSYGLKGDIGFRKGIETPFIENTSQLLILPLTIMERFLYKVGNNNVNTIYNLIFKTIKYASENNSYLNILWHPEFFSKIDYPTYSETFEFIIKTCIDFNADFLTCEELSERIKNKTLPIFEIE